MSRQCKRTARCYVGVLDNRGGFDAELRRRFLQTLAGDLAAVDMRDARIPRPIGPVGSKPRYDWPVDGPERWPVVRAWWLS